jgi:glyoxylase-like metal-dependent hydrolase (beta-lactamase superfamily II)
VFSRDPQGFHKVHRQPETAEEIDHARAALVACPVAAIRTETNAQKNHRGDSDRLTPKQELLVSQLAINPKFNGRAHPFPLRVSLNIEGVYYVGHHSEKTFGAIPYLLFTNGHGWILIDTPQFSKSAVRVVETLTGPEGPAFMLLTHVDDTSGHNDWKQHFPAMKRIFHSGDLGRNNWLGDKTLENVEVLVRGTSTSDQLLFYDMNGTLLSRVDDQEVVLIHTPGHSAGSMSLWKRPSENSKTGGILFSGDTYAHTTSGGGRMTSFPRYGDNGQLQAQILNQLAGLEWNLVAPGHGHVREYDPVLPTTKETRLIDMQPAIEELQK